MKNHDWMEFKRKGKVLARPYVPGEDMEGISVAKEDTPKGGGMIATDGESQWYINEEFFVKNYVL